MMRYLGKILACIALLLPVAAHAQVLDFDGVCAAPPCGAASLYAPFGIAISAGNVVAAGTNGLTGTNGGEYLSIAAAPYTVAFSLTRPATYFGAVVSRANTSSGAFTLRITALRTGSTVAGPVDVVLSAVNTWSFATLSAPGGFDQITMVPVSGGPNWTFGVDNAQFAGNCYGFSDVQPTDSYCNAVEWLANRAVTTGCAAGVYCPAGNVTRAQMALFMNRLGVAIAPAIYGSSGGSAVLLPSAIYLCPTGDIAAGSYPKTASLDAIVNLFAPDASTDVSAQAVYSTDGGANWTPFGNVYYQSVYAGAAPANDVGLSVQALLDLAAGQTYRFGVVLQRAAGTGTNVNPFCTLRVMTVNRNSLTAPYDAIVPSRTQGGR
jgi:hypothetical protein